MSRQPKFHKEVVQPIFAFGYVNEIFVDITPDILPGVFPYYQISNYGQVFHKYLGKFLSIATDSQGYKFVVMSTEYGPKHVQIHRIEMIAFEYFSRYELYDVNHKDGNKQNNWLGNLEWATRSENQLHAYRTGLNHRGEDSTKTNLTNETVIQVCELLQQNKYTFEEIVDIVGNGVTIPIVASIKKRESWMHISEGYKFVSRPGKLFTDDMIENICQYFQDNHIGDLSVYQHTRNALTNCGYEESPEYVDSARKIYTRKYYTNISSKYVY